MRIKNRLFPYPVLNNNKRLSDYNDKVVFELSFDKNEKIDADGYLYLKDVFLKSNSEYLMSLLSRKRVKGVLIVECSSTIYREKYDISDEPKDIRIPINSFNDDIDVSAFIYAADDIEDYSDSSFLNSYSGYHFKIEKYCILAADDGFKIEVNNQPENEDKRTSIFTIVRDSEKEDNIVRHSMGSRKILIYLPDKYYTCYNAIKYNDRFLNASFATIAIPVLLECIIKVKELLKQDDGKTIDDICFEYAWFRSICKAYEREKGVSLTEHQLKEEVDPLELAQTVLNYASCNSVNDIYSVVTTGLSSKNEENDINE